MEGMLTTARAMLMLSVCSTAHVFAHDNSSDTDKITEFPHFKVSSNGTSYTQLQGIGFAWEGTFHIHEDTWAGTYKPVKSWKVYPVAFFQTQNGTAHDLVSLNNYAVEQSYSIPYPTEITKTVGQIFPDVAIEQQVVEACETNAQELRDQGASDVDIFSEDRVLPVDADLDINMEVFAIAPPFTQAHGPDFGNPEFPPEGKITCKKWAGASVPSANDVAIENGVTNVTLDVEEKVTLGYCGLKLTGSLMTTLASTAVSYRFEEQFTGKKSAVYQLETLHNLGSGTTGPYPGFFSHNFELPYDENFDTDGKIRMVGVNHSFNTGWQSFSADCNEPIPDQIQTELPPVLELDVTPQDNIMVEGQICPSEVRMVAGVKAKSNISGQLIFVGNSYFSKLHSVQLSNGQNKQYGDYREISWQSSGGIATEAQPMGNNQPLKTKNLTVGYNITDENGKVIYQVAPKQYTLTCTKPNVGNPGQSQPGGFASEVQILDVAAVTKAKSNLSGSQCGVQIQGEVRTNLPATIKLRVRNQQGRMLRQTAAITGNNQAGSFSAYLDFRKHRLGRWIGQDGRISSTRPQQAGTYRGTLQLTATNLQMDPQTLDYQVLCHTTPTYGGGIGGFAGGNAQGAGQSASLSASALTTKKNLVAARQDKVRKPVKTIDSRLVTNTLTTRPAKKPTRKADSKKLAKASSLVASPKKVIDLAVQQLSGVAKKGKGVVVIDIANVGNARGGGSLQLLVKNRKGKIIKRHNVRVVLNKGKTRSINVPFTFDKGRVFKVSAKLNIKGDQHPNNNIKNLRLRRR